MSLIVVPPPIRLYRADRQLSPARSGEYPAEPGEGGPQGRGSTRRSRGRGARKVGGVPGEAGGGGPLEVQAAGGLIEHTGRWSEMQVLRCADRCGAALRTSGDELR